VQSNKQADNEIHEDQLRNFLVNTLGEEMARDLGENAKVVRTSDSDDTIEYRITRARSIQSEIRGEIRPRPEH
jgi:hypothetical protein